MKNKSKNFLRICQKPSNVSYREIKAALIDYGYSLGRVKGSHHIFKKQGSPQINIPVHDNKVKKPYVKIIIETLFNQIK